MREKVTAFLDVGSSFSFIRTDFAEKLKLKLCKQVKREIAVFGDCVPKSRIYNVYELNLVQTDQTLKKILVYGTDELMLEALPINSNTYKYHIQYIIYDKFTNFGSNTYK